LFSPDEVELPEAGLARVRASRAISIREYFPAARQSERFSMQIGVFGERQQLAEHCLSQVTGIRPLT
jgi:hypothetical protein